MSPCEFCQAPALSAKLRLLEAHYHEDMTEVYRRLEQLETARPFSEANPAPSHAMNRSRQSIELPCHTCQAFRTLADGWACDRRQPEFPYLCDHYSP